MHHSNVDGFLRLSMWQRVREYAVPLSMIELSAARRRAGDWAGACAAARVDVDLDVNDIRRRHGSDIAATVLTDLTYLAPDLLRWHMPRVLPDGLLRPGLTVSLARYPGSQTGQLVMRTPPAWAAGPQRMSLAWWDGRADQRHPHPHPQARFRLDLHRHLWDTRRADEFRQRGGAPQQAPDIDAVASRIPTDWAVDRWAAEAAILRDADGVSGVGVDVALGGGRHFELRTDHSDQIRPVASAEVAALAAAPGRRRRRAGAPRPVLPEAATWVPPDLMLLRAELITPDALHPLVAGALAIPPASKRRQPGPAGERPVECRGETHRIAVVDGVLTALDHDTTVLQREELLATLTGTPLPCLRVIDQLHRAPLELVDVRSRLRHGDMESAVATVEDLLGSEAVLRAGDLRDEFAAAATARRAYDAYRASRWPEWLDNGTPVEAVSAVQPSYRAARLTQTAPRRRRDRRTRRRLSSRH